jgi:hypothetical protein
MDSTRSGHLPAPIVDPTADAVEFVRFCYRRRSVGWPELYDEMCGVAGRGLFRGWGSEELNAHGIGFALFQMPALAVLVAQVLAEDTERRPRLLPTPQVRPEPAAVEAAPPAIGEAPVPVSPEVVPLMAPELGPARQDLMLDLGRDQASVTEPSRPGLVFVPNGA